MKKYVMSVRCAVVGLTLSLATVVSALGENTATSPAPRDENWVKRHEGFLAEGKKGGVDLLFLGDSITDGWRSKGIEVWNKSYAPRHAINFGIGGDRTQHVLWRIDKGELDVIKPKVTVLMIGTNNTGKEKDGKARNTTPEVIEGVTAVVKRIHAKLPNTKILLLGIFPRGEKGQPIRAQLKEINASLAKLAGPKVVYLDIADKFLESDGTLSKEIMPDLLHPNAKGYQIWADAIEPTLSGMLK